MKLSLLVELFTSFRIFLIIYCKIIELIIVYNNVDGRDTEYPLKNFQLLIACLHGKNVSLKGWLFPVRKKSSLL